MAISIVELLERHGTLGPDLLAKAFVRRFELEPNRGYGAGAYAVLSRISLGAEWRTEATRLFGGKGSYGNGAAISSVSRRQSMSPAELGNGSNVTSQDTEAGLDLETHRNAVFAVDRDTLGAIVGGIVACATGVAGIPIEWREATEALPG